VLALAREARGLTPAQAAEQMRLPADTVLAMEEGRFGDLGPAVFARGHLRKYATLLGVPPDGLIAAYDGSAQRAVEPTLIPPASAHTPVRPDGVRRLLPWQVWLAAFLAACVLGFGAWRFWSLPAAVPSTTVTPAAPAGSPGEAAGNPEQSEPLPEAAGPTDSSPESGGASPGSGTSGFLEIRFDGPCWLEVYDASGTRLAFELARAGSARAFEGGGPWRVILGNARVARLSVGGRPLSIPPSFIVRDIALVSVTADGEIGPSGSAAMRDS
jgi:cytoskeleton protein RodZ